MLAQIWLGAWSSVFVARNMTPLERDAAFMVPTPAAAAVVAGEGGEQRGVSCSASSSARSAISTSLGSNSGWDVEADAALLELLREDSKVLSEVRGVACSESHT